MFVDGFESYTATGSLTDGSGDHSYVTASGGLNGISIVSSGAAEGARKVSFDYTASGEITRLLESFDVTGDGDVVNVSYNYRNVGTVYHVKQFIVFKNGSGTRRFVFDGWGIIAPLSLSACWYNGGLYGTAKTPDIPPAGNSAQGWNSDPTGYQYKQNMGYLAFQMNDDINDGNWHRYTTRFQRELGGAGTGRIEGWVDGIKIMEYIGDDPARCEYQKVFTASTSESMVEGFQFPTTTSGGNPWNGGATIEFDAIRIWR